ncbi:MAG: MFS transporter [Rhizobiales bacterium]|nr:MFS transporter [Hyphomicrobiales bacterium]
MVYFALFAQAGLNQPFLPLWLTSRGLNETQIAAVISAPLLLRIMVAPAIGMIADRTGDRALIMRCLAAGVFLLALCLSQAGGFWTILLLATSMMLLSQAIPPVVDASVISLIRGGKARDFGRMRLWGSGGFAAATILGGFILAWGGVDAVFAAFVCAILLQIAASFILPGGAARAKERSETRLDLHKRPALIVVFLVAALTLTSHATFNSFGSLHFRRLGFPESAIGLLWATATLSEVAMFWAGPFLSRRLSAFGVLVLAASVAVARWSLMSLDAGLPATVLLQMLHAATFSGSYIGLMRFMAQVGDHVGARAQSAFATIFGLMTALTTLAMGPIYSEIGARGFLVTALLPALALLLLFGFRRRLRLAEAGEAA